MRRISDLSRLADIMRSCCCQDDIYVDDLQNGSMIIRAPFVPSILFEVISSSVRVSVHAYSDHLLTLSLELR